MDFLKPNKANVIGTAALLVANWVVGLLSRFAINPMVFSAMGVQMQGGRGGFGGGFGGAGSGGMMPFGGAGLAAGAVELVILAAAFYVILSLVIGKLAETARNEGAGGQVKGA